MRAAAFDEELDGELEKNDFDWQPVWKMREPAPEPTEPAPPQPSEPSEPTPEPEQPEPAPPAPQSAPMEPEYFPLQPELAALCQCRRKLVGAVGIEPDSVETHAYLIAHKSPAVR